MSSGLQITAELSGGTSMQGRRASRAGAVPTASAIRENEPGTFINL